MNGITEIIRIYGKNCNGVTASIRGKGILFMIVFLMMCSGVLVPQAVWSIDPDQRETFIASLPQGEAFENDGSTYAWLPTLKAEKTEMRKDITTEAVVERKGPFSVYVQSPAEEASIRTAEGPSGNVQAHPVVLNLETKSIGIITGNIWLKLKDMQEAQPIADSYNITLSFVNAPMMTAFYEFPGDVNILSLRKRLETDARIMRVTLDMVDRIRLPQ